MPMRRWADAAPAPPPEWLTSPATLPIDPATKEAIAVDRVIVGRVKVVGGGLITLSTSTRGTSTRARLEISHNSHVANVLLNPSNLSALVRALGRLADALDAAIAKDGQP